MKFKMPAQQWALTVAILFFLLGASSAISTRKASKGKNSDHVAFKNNEEKLEPESDSGPEKLADRQGVHSEFEHYDESDPAETSELVKKTQNVSAVSKPVKRIKEESPINADVIHPSELDGVTEGERGDNGEHLAKSEFTRESRGDKNQRIYYDDTTPRYNPHSGVEGLPYENEIRQGKQKDGAKYYFPKNYMNKQHHLKSGHRPSPSVLGISGKRIPDHVSFDEEGHSGHEYPSGHGEHGNVGHVGIDESPYPHGLEEHHGKGHGHAHHPVSNYGYHYGNYRHTIGDKVDAVGKALQVLIPSALLITGVSALFPNRVHVPTTPNKHRQKRSVYRRIPGPRMLMPGPPPPPLMSHMPRPEFDDIPSHILEAEHRMIGADIYSSEYGKRMGSSGEATGFNPFRVFKGPGPETSMKRIHDSLPLPEFPNMPNDGVLHENSRVQYLEDGTPVAPPSTYVPAPESLEEGIPPPPLPVRQIATTQMSLRPPTIMSIEVEERAKPEAIMRRRKTTTRKPSIFIKETSKPIALASRSSEVQRSSNYVAKGGVTKNSLEDLKVVNPVKAEEEFMASLQNLVTPEVSKSLQATAPKNFDLSPDGPVMGLLTSYAQHEKDSPLCQKRALCELAVKGKQPKATKFEAFLWSVATLVPDVFSEMYDLQEVFQAIRDERCVRFNCSNPNLDIQAK